MKEQTLTIKQDQTPTTTDIMEDFGKWPRKPFGIGTRIVL